MSEACGLDELKVGDIIAVRGSVVRFFTNEQFRERKSRPAVVVWADGGVIAAPIYTTNGEKPAEGWDGPRRIGLFADAQNKLREPRSQFGISNAFILSPDNLGCRFGRLANDDREIARHEFLRIATMEAAS
ncbi:MULTISPECIES: hypothetical protein [Sphingomonas]|jgi:hypothetical protein|uniref:hypothetical protein n=1 Tax=Sphingomonas TaxID=13687 RepID=UPI0020C8019A|nr:hypothetical protein [Sphingomonas faeni]MCP8892926.1 hypothetical protein [Sphingomonas faeni]